MDPFEGVMGRKRTECEDAEPKSDETKPGKEADACV